MITATEFIDDIYNFIFNIRRVFVMTGNNVLNNYHNYPDEMKKYNLDISKIENNNCCFWFKNYNRDYHINLYSAKYMLSILGSENWHYNLDCKMRIIYLHVFDIIRNDIEHICNKAEYLLYIHSYINAKLNRELNYDDFLTYI